jgi:hypothetical protein
MCGLYTTGQVECIKYSEYCGREVRHGLVQTIRGNGGTFSRAILAVGYCPVHWYRHEPRLRLENAGFVFARD